MRNPPVLNRSKNSNNNVSAIKPIPQFVIRNLALSNWPLGQFESLIANDYINKHTHRKAVLLTVNIYFAQRPRKIAGLHRRSPVAVNLMLTTKSRRNNPARDSLNHKKQPPIKTYNPKRTSHLPVLTKAIIPENQKKLNPHNKKTLNIQTKIKIRRKTPIPRTEKKEL